MKQVKNQLLNLWEFENLKRLNLGHFVTERTSPIHGKEFTLSYSSSPDRSEIQHNRSLLAEAMGISADKLFFPSQVHKTRIVHVTPETKNETLLETDALITNTTGICIAVMSADCVPILLYDVENHAVGAVHSGWRGTVAKILEKTLHEMKSAFGTQGKNVIAGIGPSVSQEAYEVGEEVVQEVIKSFGDESGLLIPQLGNKAKLDLWKANHNQLTAFGVPETQIEISNLCTVKNNNHFFSARKGDSGRFAAGIMLR